MLKFTDKMFIYSVGLFVIGVVAKDMIALPAAFLFFWVSTVKSLNK